MLYADGRWDEVVARLALIPQADLDTDHGVELAAKAERHIEVRDQRLADEYGRATDALRAADWSVAVARLEQLVEEVPDYRDAAAELERARAGLASEQHTAYPPPPPSPRLSHAESSYQKERSAEPKDEKEDRRLIAVLLGVGAVVLIVAGLFVTGVLPLGGDEGAPGYTVARGTATTVTNGVPSTSFSTPSTLGTATRVGTVPSLVLTATEVSEMYGDSVVALEGVGCGFGFMTTGVVLGGIVVSSSAAGSSFRGAAFPDGIPVRTRGLSVDGRFAVLDDGGFLSNLDPPNEMVRPGRGDSVVVLGRASHLNATIVSIEAVVASTVGTGFDIKGSGLSETMVGAPVFAADGDLLGIIEQTVDSDASVVPLDVVADVGAVDGGPDCSAVLGSVEPVDFSLMERDEDKALLLAQYLATSLAHDDWDTVRQVDPSLAGEADAYFMKGWGLLEVSTLIPVWIDEMESSLYELRLGLVAHEREHGQPMTKLFCVTWESDLEAGTVDQTGRDPRNGISGKNFLAELQTRQGVHVNPSELAEVFFAVC